jgi:integrase/recombinase XerC
LELVSGVHLLHEEDAIVKAMLSGWEKQQHGGRGLARKTIADRRRTVERFIQFTNEYPWRWTATHVDEWMTSLVSEERKAKSSVRNHQTGLRLFCDYLTSPHYDWPSECDERFGTHPVQVCHEWNTVAHVTDYEGHPARRPMTRTEIQRLFDYADDRVERAVRSGRKGALAAYRDATIFKVIYGWGLRCRETVGLDLADLHRNPEAPELGRFGALHVRWGKASRGSAPKRRTVLTVMPWAAEAFEDYVVNIRPRFGLEEHPAIWVTERGGRVRTREVEDRFATYRDALNMPTALTPHCLRHSYVTHQIEDGADPKFVQDQVGHRFASTTAIYTNVSGDFMNTMMRKVLDKALERDQEWKR